MGDLLFGFVRVGCHWWILRWWVMMLCWMWLIFKDGMYCHLPDLYSASSCILSGCFGIGFRLLVELPLYPKLGTKSQRCTLL